MRRIITAAILLHGHLTGGLYWPLFWLPLPGLVSLAVCLTMGGALAYIVAGYVTEVIQGFRRS